MRTRGALALAGLAATAVLGLAVGPASAGKLSFSNQRFRIVWASVEFTGELGTPIIRCPVTMEGSFHSATFQKQVGLLVGYISRATAVNTSCTGGTATLLQTNLPWHLKYNRFYGTLPNITTIEFVVGTFEVRLKAEDICLFIANGLESAIGIEREVGGAANGAHFQANFELQKVAGGGLCFNTRINTEGGGRLTLLGNTAAITIRLI